MNPRKTVPSTATALAGLILTTWPASAQIGTRFPSKKKIVAHPVTGVPLTFLTSTPAGDSKIYQTHCQWTAEGQWIVFISERLEGQAMAAKGADQCHGPGDRVGALRNAL